MLRLEEYLKDISNVILADATFRTLCLNSTTVTYLNIRAEEIIKAKIIMKQAEEINSLKETI